MLLELLNEYGLEWAFRPNSSQRRIVHLPWCFMKVNILFLVYLKSKKEKDLKKRKEIVVPYRGGYNVKSTRDSYLISTQRSFHIRGKKKVCQRKHAWGGA